MVKKKTTKKKVSSKTIPIPRKNKGFFGLKFYILLLVPLSIILIDQLTKFLIRSYVHSFREIIIIDRILYISSLTNTGAAFGILKDKNMILGLFPILLLIGIIYYYKNIPQEKNLLFSLGLILGGSLGNLIDRIYLGHVIDFIDFTFWPAFNIADSAICIGAILLIIEILRKD